MSDVGAPKEYEEVSDGGEGEYDEEEIEVEVEEEDAAVASLPNSDVGTPKKKADTPAVTTPKPGRVTPSSAVKAVAHRTPEQVAATSRHALSTTKNPFPIKGEWTPQEFSQVSIQFPVLTALDETTNELTRSSRPESRYWKAQVTFKYSTYSSDTLRIQNVHIPWHSGNGYGTNYVYAQLPGFMAKSFADAGKTRRPTKVDENSLVHDENRWWKIANNVSDKFGVITNGKFHPKSLATILEGSGKGLTVTIVARFKVKASTVDKSPLKPTTTSTVAMEIERAYIFATDVDVQMPVRVSRKKATMEPMATKSDVATDSLMERLSQLGL